MRLVQRASQLVVDGSSGAGIFTFLNPRAKIYPQAAYGAKKNVCQACHSLKTDLTWQSQAKLDSDADNFPPGSEDSEFVYLPEAP